MSLKSLASQKTADVKGDQDRLGGSNLLPTDVYEATITLAYTFKSTSGSTGVVIQAKNDAGKTISTTQYITSGTAKGCKTYSEKDGVKTFLPGYNLIDALCQLTVGKSIVDMDEEEKVFNIYNYDQKKEIPTKVNAIVELFGKKAQFGVTHVIVNKRANNADTNEKRETNEVDKIFQSETGLTQVEIQAKETNPAFLVKWLEANKGKVIDKFKPVAGGVAGIPPVTGAAPGASSLFGDV